MFKRLLMSLILGICLIFFSEVGLLHSAEIPSGYGKVKFGMSKNEVKQILREEGRVIIEETNKRIKIEDKLFDEKVHIDYGFTAITQKCMNVAIYFHYSSDLYSRITKSLIEKFGKPYPTYVDGQSLPKWTWRSRVIILLRYRQNDSMFLGYVDQDLVDIGKEEQEKLDIESKNKL